MARGINIALCEVRYYDFYRFRAPTASRGPEVPPQPAGPLASPGRRWCARPVATGSESWYEQMGLPNPYRGRSDEELHVELYELLASIATNLRGGQP